MEGLRASPAYTWEELATTATQRLRPVLATGLSSKQHASDISSCNEKQHVIDMLIRQIASYFSYNNLLKNASLRCCMDSQGYVLLDVFMKFHRIQSLSTDTGIVRLACFECPEVDFVIGVEDNRDRIRRAELWHLFVFPMGKRNEDVNYDEGPTEVIKHSRNTLTANPSIKHIYRTKSPSKATPGFALNKTASPITIRSPSPSTKYTSSLEFLRHNSVKIGDRLNGNKFQCSCEFTTAYKKNLLRHIKRCEECATGAYRCSCLASYSPVMKSAFQQHILKCTGSKVLRGTQEILVKYDEMARNELNIRKDATLCASPNVMDMADLYTKQDYTISFSKGADIGNSGDPDEFQADDQQPGGRGDDQADGSNHVSESHQMQLMSLEHHKKKRVDMVRPEQHRLCSIFPSPLMLLMSNLHMSPDAPDCEVPGAEGSQGSGPIFTRAWQPKPLERADASSLGEENDHMTAIVPGNNEDPYPPLLPMNSSSRLQTIASNNTKAWVEELKVLEAFRPTGRPCTPEPSENSSSCSQFNYDGGGSSADEPSIVTDSDVLSISDTSDPELCLTVGPLSTMQGRLLGQVLEDYNNWRLCQSGGVCADAASLPSASRPSTCSAAQANTAKRKFSDRDPTAEVNSGPSSKATKSARNDDVHPKVLACPFWKHDRERHRLCCKLSHKRIRDVKQHLHRRHTPEMYCDRCLEVFDDTERYEVHVESAVPCFRVPESRLQGITRVQSRAISRKSDRNQGEQDQWFAIWDILFPGTKRPASAYVHSELTEEMNSFQEYWTNRGHDVLMDELNLSDIWSLSAEERDTQGRQILALGLNSIYELWNDSRGSTSLTQAATGMFASPPLTNTSTSSSGFIPTVDQAIQVPTDMPDQEGVSSAVAANTQGDVMPERNQIEFDEFGFTDFLNIETARDLDFDF